MAGGDVSNVCKCLSGRSEDGIGLCFGGVQWKDSTQLKYRAQIEKQEIPFEY